jgi:FlaA1/EpsC-like NDP-sugar epimerase
MRQSVSAAASRMRADITFAAVDVVAVVVSYAFGLGLRMLDPGITEPQVFWQRFFTLVPIIVVVHIVANAVAGAYGHVWEHASTNEALRVAFGNAAAMGVILSGSWWIRSASAVVLPWSMLVVGGLLSFLLMGLVRFRSRLFSFRKVGEGSRIMIVGTDSDAASFARRAPEIEAGGRVVGFVLDGETESGSVRRLAGLPILGCLSQIPDLVIAHEIDQIVVVGNDPARSRGVVDRCIDIDVRLRILPGAGDVLSESGSSLDVRDIQVDDLLVRAAIATDLSAVADLLEGKTVLVTGGGGSIGSEVVRQVLQFDPEIVWALDRDETLLHNGELQWTGPVKTVLGDVRDGDTLLRTLERIRPDVVFHAAALKHVPVLENHPEEAVLANVVGTRNVIEAGSRTGMERFVLISTDKAVDPTSVMGASKRVAELLVKAGNERNDGCVYSAVRFGNVLGSRGSVIPTFVSQIKSGGPVTVTDPEMTRYFMTVDEAVQLVLQASSMATGSEVFLLDMGEPVRIEDLARRLIRLAGLIPEADIAIEYTGIRPGEKLRETLATGPLSTTTHPKVFEAQLTHPGAGTLLGNIADLEKAAKAGESDTVVAILNRLAEGHLAGHHDKVPDSETQLTSSWS